jgi:general stress protein YciG
MALTKEAREFFVMHGRKGGKAYAKNSTPEQRKAAARHAAQARWAKANKKKTQ